MYIEENSIPVLQKGGEDLSSYRCPMYVTLYRHSIIKEILYWFSIICSCGTLWIVLHWFPILYVHLRYKVTTDVLSACKVIVFKKDGKKAIAAINRLSLSLAELHAATGRHKLSFDVSAKNQIIDTVMFEHLCLRYIYDSTTRCFEYAKFDVEVPAKDIYKLFSNGIQNPETLKQRRLLYGPGCVQISLPPLYKVIFEEILHPFFVFQILAVSLWLWDEYYLYSGAILAITIISLSQEIYTIRRNHLRLRDIATFDTKQYVKQASGDFVVKDPEEIVPGDIIQINYGVLPCDMILLQGSVLINESMISGECVPVLKSSLNSVSQYYSSDKITTKVDYQNSQYLIFGGTEVVQLKTTLEQPLGLVIRTGFSTVQGRMIRDIIHPKRNEFVMQTYKYLIFLVIIAFILAFMSLFITMSYQLHTNVIIIRFFDTFTNAIPPLLPASMLVGANFAVLRLQRIYKIMCIVPSKINTAGQVNTFVLDKTGTLTENTYSIEGVVTTDIAEATDINEKIRNTVEQKEQTKINALFTDFKKLPEEIPCLFREAMASCQSLSVVKNTLVGDLMEEQILKYTGWELNETFEDKNIIKNFGTNTCLCQVESKDKTHKVFVLRRFEFLPEVQRMSVCTYTTPKNKFYVFCKGSPEQLEQRCIKSTLPIYYNELLQRYTKYGMRVLAYGYKELDHFSDDCMREDVETDLIFLGIIIFINKLKPETSSVVQSLKEAGCRCILATGDNPYTSTAIALESSIIESNSIIFIGSLIENKKDGRKVHDDKIITVSSPMTTVPDDEKTSTNKNFIETSEKTSQLKDTENIDSTSIIWSLFHCDPSVVNKLSENHEDKEVFLPAKNVTTTADELQRLLKVSKSPCTYNTNNKDCIADDNIPTTASSPIISSDKAQQQYFINEDLTEGIQLSTTDIVKLINEQSPISTNITLVLTGSLLAHLQNLSYTNEYLIQLVQNPEILLSQENKKTSPEIKDVVSDASNITATDESMSFFEYCLRRCRVYSRMTPQNKAYLITQLQSLPGRPIIGMCGDGANDCEALKTADIGVSLSGAVTSLCAPITSMKQSLQGCYDILCEGRGALVNSFQAFKYVTLYALTLVFSIQILYFYGGNLTDSQYLWVDLILDLPLVMTMAWTHSATKLTQTLPLRRLIGLPVMLSILGQVAIQMAFLFLSLGILTQTSFYERFVPSKDIDRFEDIDLEGYENTTIFMVTIWQYLIMNVIIASGRPWRKSRFTNIFYTLTLIILIFLHLAIFVGQELFNDLKDWVSVVDLPGSFRALLVFLLIVHFIAGFYYERYFIGQLTRREMQKDIKCNTIDHITHFIKN